MSGLHPSGPRGNEGESPRNPVTYYLLCDQPSTVHGWDSGNGSIDIWDSSRASNRQWRISSAGNAYHRLTPMSPTGSFLDVSGASTSNGANVQIWQDVGAGNRQYVSARA